MLKEIKAYWHELKTEYENRYGEEILRDYDKSNEYLEKMQGYLESKLAENPSNVDIVCTLASVNLELRCGDEAYVELLEDFLDEFGDDLDESSKARIYTNVAFVEDYSQKALEYLNKAKERKLLRHIRRSGYITFQSMSTLGMRIVLSLVVISLRWQRE